MTPRTYHFASAEHAEALEGLWQSPGDALFIDLEDGVQAQHKDEARENARRFFDAGDRTSKRVVLRINEVGGPHWLGDVDRCAPVVDRLMVPLLEGPEPLVELDALLTRIEREGGLPEGSRRLHLLVETAAAVVRLRELIAATPRVEGLFFGAADFSLSVRASGIGGGAFRPGPVVEWTHPTLLLHARAHGLEAAAPAWAPAGDADAQIAEMRRMYEMGYDALVVGSPTGVERANAARRPAPDDLAFAVAVRQAYDAAAANGTGPAFHDGWGIEAAMARVADRVIERGD